MNARALLALMAATAVVAGASSVEAQSRDRTQRGLNRGGGGGNGGGQAAQQPRSAPPAARSNSARPNRSAPPPPPSAAQSPGRSGASGMMQRQRNQAPAAQQSAPSGMPRQAQSAQNGTNLQRPRMQAPSTLAPSSGIPGANDRSSRTLSRSATGATPIRVPSSGINGNVSRPNRMSVPLPNGVDTQRSAAAANARGGFDTPRSGGRQGTQSGLVRDGTPAVSSGVGGTFSDDRTTRNLVRDVPRGAAGGNWNGGQGNGGRGGSGNWGGGGWGGGGGGGRGNWNNNGNWNGNNCGNNWNGGGGNWCNTNWNSCSSSNWSVSIGLGSWNSWCSPCAPSWGWGGWNSGWCAPTWSSCSPCTTSWWWFGTGGWWSSGLGWGWSVGSWATPAWSVSTVVPISTTTYVADYAVVPVSDSAFVVGAFDDLPGYDVPLETVYATAIANPPTTPAPAINPEIEREAKRAERALLAKVNPHYDVVPDFAVAVSAAASSDYSEAIGAMRRAALVNPEALVGAQTRLARDIAADPDRAQRVRYALNVFQNPPRRVVSEADAQFMVAAFSAALGNDDAAAQAIQTAKMTGDRSASTELLSRAITTDELRTSGWTTGAPLN